MRWAEMIVGQGRKNVLAQQFQQDRNLLIVMDAEPMCWIVLGYQGGGIVPLTPKNLGTKTTKHVSNIPHIQLVLCGFLENCMFWQSSPDVFIVF